MGNQSMSLIQKLMEQRSWHAMLHRASGRTASRQQGGARTHTAQVRAPWVGAGAVVACRLAWRDAERLEISEQQAIHRRWPLTNFGVRHSVPGIPS